MYFVNHGLAALAFDHMPHTTLQKDERASGHHSKQYDTEYRSNLSDIDRYTRIFYVPEHIDPESFIRPLQHSTTAQALNPVISNVRLSKRCAFGYSYGGNLGRAPAEGATYRPLKIEHMFRQSRRSDRTESCHGV